MENKPNPGSEEAVKQGCVCPIEDNHKGKGVPYVGERCFWINGDCPLHGLTGDYNDQCSVDVV